MKYAIIVIKTNSWKMSLTNWMRFMWIHFRDLISGLSFWFERFLLVFLNIHCKFAFLDNFDEILLVNSPKSENTKRASSTNNHLSPKIKPVLESSDPSDKIMWKSMGEFMVHRDRSPHGHPYNRSWGPGVGKYWPWRLVKVKHITGLNNNYDIFHIY